MAGPKSDKDQYFGLTPSQAKMILLGALYTEDSKVRFANVIPNIIPFHRSPYLTDRPSSPI